MPTRGKKDPNGRALRGRRAHTTFASSVDPAAQIWSNYNVRSGASGAATPEQPAVQNCLYDRFEALYEKSSIKPSLVIVPARFKSGTLYSEIPTSGAGDFTVTRATAATRVNASGLIESVASGIPRLDYFASGGVVGCPALLVEPSAQNLAFHSENWASNWAAGTQSGTTVVTGSAISLAPDGTATANEIYPTSGNTNHARQSNATTQITYVSGTIYTQSAFFKAGVGVGTRVQLTFGAARFSQDGYANFDLSAGTVLVVSGTSADTNRAARIENYGNGWYRCSFTATCNIAGSTTGLNMPLINASGATRLPTFSGTVTDYVLGWGAQVETGSVATSYIPTTTAAVTRNTDLIFTSGAVSGAIGQTEGTLYAEVDVRNFTVGSRIISISDGTQSNRISTLFVATNAIRMLATVTGTTQASITSATQSAGIFKIAIGYALNDYALYINGVQIGTDTLASVPACNVVVLGSVDSLSSGNAFNDRIRAAALYTTRLSNTQLAFITQP
jgi:hypothetical protein